MKINKEKCLGIFLPLLCKTCENEGSMLKHVYYTSGGHTGGMEIWEVL